MKTLLATLTLTTLTVGLYAGTAAADQATCTLTAQPQNEKSYHLAYTGADDQLVVLWAHQTESIPLPPTDFEIPADFKTVHWTSVDGWINGRWHNNLGNGGGCTFDREYDPNRPANWRASVVITPGHTPSTTSSTVPTTSTTAPTTTTSTTVDLPPATVPPTTTTTSPAITTWRTTPLPDQPPVAIPPGSDVAIDPPTSTTPTPYTAVPRLPDTGAAHITALLSAGALSLFAGLLAVGLTPLRRAMNNHRKDLK